MYSTYYQTPTRLARMVNWLAAPELRHAIAASAIVIATITAAWTFDSVGVEPIGAAQAASVPVATVVVATPSASIATDVWNADDSASGTMPDRAH